MTLPTVYALTSSSLRPDAMASSLPSSLPAPGSVSFQVRNESLRALGVLGIAVLMPETV